MARPRRGRPSKGRRDEFRVVVPAQDTLLIYGLCRLHQRDRGAIISAATVVGLHHLDELPQAAVTWHLTAAPLPDGLPLDGDELPDWVKTSLADGLQRLRLMLPTVYTGMVESTAARYAPTQMQRPGIRSALLWIGLHHPEEIGLMLAELDDVQRGLAAGQTALSFYDGSLVATGRSAEDMARARELLRRRAPVNEVADATGIPVELLEEIRTSIVTPAEAKEGQYALMPAV